MAFTVGRSAILACQAMVAGVSWSLTSSGIQADMNPQKFIRSMSAREKLDPATQVRARRFASTLWAPSPARRRDSSICSGGVICL